MAKIKYFINKECETEFVIQIHDKKTQLTRYIVDIPGLISFLECNGFRKYPISTKEYIPIRLEYGHIIVPVSEYYMKDVVMYYLEENGKTEEKNQFHYRDYFNKNLVTSLETFNFNLHTGNKDSCYIYYKNGVLKITKNDFEILSYEELDGFIWKEQIINRDIKLPIASHLENFNFNKFLRNISGQADNRYFSLVSIIGYLLHNFKDKSLAKAIIFTDEDIDVNGISANGGKGKSILASALSKMTNVCKKEGKNIETGNRFFLQDIELHNNILYFDDVKQDFDFESLYSAITGSITSEKKFKTPITIPFEYSPKILISSNYTVIGKEGYTDERRRIDFEFSSYYNRYRNPNNEFNETFFDDWDDEAWFKFDSLMIYCIQFYLNYGLIEPPKIRFHENKVIQNTHPTFFEFMESKLLRHKSYNKKELFNEYVSEYKDDISNITIIAFKKWLDYYLLYYKKWKFTHYKSNSNAMIKIL
ncbi:MAG: hypothetical protein U0T69_09170 [Chitinophagales bacterium]